MPHQTAECGIRYWQNIFGVVVILFIAIWNVITPTSFTLSLYRNANATRGVDIPDQRVDGYDNLKACQEKGVEFTQRGYAQFTCGERCKNPAVGEIDCFHTYY